MSLYKRGETWWYRFEWRGDEIRESTKVSNQREAEKIEAARKTQLARDEVGLKGRKPAPTLREFVEKSFRPHIAVHFAEKIQTRRYYGFGLKAVLAYPALAEARLDETTADILNGFVAKLRGTGWEVSTMNRTLQVLRRVFKLAQEWGATDRVLPKVRLLPGENRRERTLTEAESEAYLAAAETVGAGIIAEYERALEGIRAVDRGETPIKPADPYLLRDVATLLCDCGLRPDEAFRLRWEQVRDGAVHIQTGKTANARRMVPLSEQAAALLEARREAALSAEWVFPSPTMSGHIEHSTLKKRHHETEKLAEVAPFTFYTFRHTCLTRWSSAIDPYTLAYLAGHSDFATTKRYVHPRLEVVRAMVEKARDAQTPHKIRHSGKMEAVSNAA